MATAPARVAHATRPSTKTLQAAAGHDNFSNAAATTTALRHFNEPRDSVGRASNQGPSGARAASNSQTRKKKSKPSNTTAALRQTLPATQEISNPTYGLQPAELQGRAGPAHRSSGIATTTSTKSKKKKQ